MLIFPWPLLIGKCSHVGIVTAPFRSASMMSSEVRLRHLGEIVLRQPHEVLLPMSHQTTGRTVIIARIGRSGGDDVAVFGRCDVDQRHPVNSRPSSREIAQIIASGRHDTLVGICTRGIRSHTNTFGHGCWRRHRAHLITDIARINGIGIDKS